MKTSTALLPLAIAAALAAAGCASPTSHATFVTKTSLALVDADAAPAGISIAYDRVEGYVGPRLEDGKVLPVTGFVETDGGIFVRNIRQVYATGDAADIVAGHVAGAASAASAPAAAASAPNREVLFFGTGTTYGLKLGFAPGTIVPDSLVLGVRRKEISVVPVEQGSLPSVFASIDNTTDATAGTGTRPDANFGLRQFFATGSAATRIAQAPEVGGIVKRRVSAEQMFRQAEASQGKDALDALWCLSRLDDALLPRVWNNAEDLRVLPAPTLAEMRRAGTAALAQRQLYTRDIGLANAASDDHGRRLALHREAVCQLAPKP